MKFFPLFLATISPLAAQLERFLEAAPMQTASVGIAIVPVEKEEPLFLHNPDTSLIPASTLKTVTTATALQLLGPDFTFETKFYLIGEDLVIKGGGDPTFCSSRPDADFPGVLKALKAAGIKEIKGKIIADASFFESRTTPNEWPWGDVGNYYGAGPSGLNFHANSFDASFRPGLIGKTAKLKSTYPTPPRVIFENHMLTGPKGSGDQGFAYSGPGANIISFRGTIPTGKVFSIRCAMPDPPYSCAEELKTYLGRHKITVLGESDVRAVDVKDAQPMYVHKSPDLATIVKATNHRSVNLYAESMFKALTPKGSTVASLKKIKDHWSTQGVNLVGCVMYDGSGLAPRNSITPRQLVDILKKARKHETGQMFMESLPVAGREGTASTFGRTGPLAGKAWVKSGSMDRVNCFAGYFVSKSSREYVFAVMTNNALTPPKNHIARLISHYAQEAP